MVYLSLLMFVLVLVGVWQFSSSPSTCLTYQHRRWIDDQSWSFRFLWKINSIIFDTLFRIFVVISALVRSDCVDSWCLSNPIESRLGIFSPIIPNRFDGSSNWYSISTVTHTPHHTPHRTTPWGAHDIRIEGPMHHLVYLHIDHHFNARSWTDS